MKEAIETGKTVEEAIDNACAKLGLERDEVEFEVLELPKKGFLGLKNTPAKVRVYQEETKISLALDYLRSVLDAIGLDTVEFDVQEQEGGAVISLKGEGLGVVIGHRGETLDALQYLTGLVANRKDGEYFRITIDSGDFREKQEKTLEGLARKIASNAIKSGKSATLEPMNPYERRIIHAAVQKIEGVTSTSVGEEPNRRVVISPLHPPRKNRPEGGRGGNRPYRGGSDRRSRSGGRRPPRQTEKPDLTPSEKYVAPAEAEDKPLYSKIEID